jgi:hypothetical protein
MDNSRSCSAPLLVGYGLRNVQNDETFNNQLYQKAIGSLLHLSNCTRPDLAFTICKLRQKCPLRSDWTHIKHVLRYLVGTANSSLKFFRKQEPVMVYSDADWAKDPTDRRSISGFVILLAGGPIVWQSKKQRVVASSTVEAEYIALYEAVKEVVWLRQFLLELNQEKFVTLPINTPVDDRGAMCVAKNKISSKQTKHIDIRFHGIREKINDGINDLNM